MQLQHHSRQIALISLIYFSITIVLATVSKADTSSKLLFEEYAESTEPVGFSSQYCKSDPDYCRIRELAPPIKLDKQLLKSITSINSALNKQLGADLNNDLFGNSEAIGFAKARHLEKQLGLSPSNILLTVVGDEKSLEWVAVTLVTTDGEIILDARDDSLKKPKEVEFKFLKRQSRRAATAWMTISEAIPSWVGFRQTKNLDIPIKDKILTTTYQISHPSGFNSVKSDFAILETDKQKKITNKKRLNSDPRALQIETCRRQNLKKCPVSKLTATSTAVVQAGNYIHTCRHSFQNWLALATETNSMDLKQIYPPFVIRNYKGEVVFNSAYSDQEPTIDFINEERKLNRVLNENTLIGKPRSYFEISDYIAFQLNSKITDSPNFAISSRVEKNDSLYLSGYPGKTKHFGGVKKGDSPGGKLVTSSGSLIDTYDLQYTISNISFGGNSGSSVFNQRGDLVGIVCQGDLKSSNTLQLEKEKALAVWEYYLHLLNDLE